MKLTKTKSSTISNQSNQKYRCLNQDKHNIGSKVCLLRSKDQWRYKPLQFQGPRTYKHHLSKICYNPKIQRKYKPLQFQGPRMYKHHLSKIWKPKKLMEAFPIYCDNSFLEILAWGESANIPRHSTFLVVWRLRCNLHPLKCWLLWNSSYSCSRRFLL